jgi:hypothetical protein
MVRDFELVRKLLFYFEEKNDALSIENPVIEGYEPLVIRYHCRLLYDVGFLRCEPIKSRSSDRVINVLPFELTWDGHEFLEKIRSDTTWNKIKSFSQAKGVALTFSVVSGLTKKWVTDKLLGA